MPALLSASSSLLREFWGLQPSKSEANGVTGPDPLPRFEKLEPAHASSVVSLTRVCSHLISAFIGVLVAHCERCQEPECSPIWIYMGVSYIWGYPHLWNPPLHHLSSFWHKDAADAVPGTELPQAGQLEDPEKNFLSKKRPATAPSSVAASNPRKRRKNRNKNSFSALEAWNCHVFHCFSLFSQEAIHHVGNSLGFYCVHLFFYTK